MLQNDRHFVRIEFTHPGRKPHALRMGVKTNVKVMISGKAVTRCTRKDLPDDSAQSVLDKEIVTDQVNHHSNRPLTGPKSG
jgi:hypothetical protein